MEAFCGYLKVDLRRAFITWKNPITIILIYVALLYNKNMETDIIGWVSSVNQVVLIVIALALASVPYASSYVEDVSHKYKRQMILRGDGNTYIYSRVIVVFLSAFVVFFVAFIIAGITFYFYLGIPDYKADSIEHIKIAKSAYYLLILKGKYLLYFLACTIHLSCLAGIMALMGLLISQLIHNQMAVYGFPNVLIYLQDVFVQRLFGWEKGSTISLNWMGVALLDISNPGQSAFVYYTEILSYFIVLLYGIRYLNQRDWNE